MANDGLEFGAGLVSQQPGGPQLYPTDLDQRILREAELVLGTGDFEAIRARIGTLLQNFPLRRFLQILGTRPPARHALEQAVVPFINDWAEAYAQRTIPFPHAHPLSRMTQENKLRFGLLEAKSPSTAEHCVDAFGMMNAIGWVTSQTDPSLPVSTFREEMQLAAVDHDLGKAEIAALFLLAPFNREHHLPKIFRANLVDPKRKRPIGGLHVLSPEQAAYFEPILDPRNTGEPLREDLVDELMDLLTKLMKEQKFAFHNIPLRYLAKVMRDMDEEGHFPSYVPGLEGEQIDPAYLPFLREHKNDLEHLELIFAIHNIDGYEVTLRDVLDGHEAHSVDLVRGEVGEHVIRLIGNHHRYKATVKRFGIEWANLNGLIVPAEMVAMGDVGSALSQVAGRAYFDAKGKPAPLVAKIFRDELKAKKLADPDRIELIARLIELGRAPAGEVMPKFYQNVNERFGAPWVIAS
jgi:hypothetical protein